MLILIFALTFAAATLFASYVTQRELHPARRRILEAVSETPVSGPQGSFFERILAPSVQSFGDFLGRLLPTSIAKSVETLLQQAGNPITFQNFLTLWFVVASSSIMFVLLIIAPSVSVIRILIWGGFSLSFGFF